MSYINRLEWYQNWKFYGYLPTLHHTVTKSVSSIETTYKAIFESIDYRVEISCQNAILIEKNTRKVLHKDIFCKNYYCYEPAEFECPGYPESKHQNVYKFMIKLMSEEFDITFGCWYNQDYKQLVPGTMIIQPMISIKETNIFQQLIMVELEMD